MSRNGVFSVIMLIGWILSAQPEDPFLKSITPNIERFKEHIRYAKLQNKSNTNNSIHVSLPDISGCLFLDGNWAQRWPNDMYIDTSGEGTTKTFYYMHGKQYLEIRMDYFFNNTLAELNFFSHFGATTQSEAFAYRLGPKGIGRLCLITAERGGAIQFIDKNVWVSVLSSSDSVDTISMAKWISKKLNKFSLNGFFTKAPSPEVIRFYDCQGKAVYTFDSRNPRVFHCKVGNMVEISISSVTSHRGDIVEDLVVPGDWSIYNAFDVTKDNGKWIIKPLLAGNSIIRIVLMDPKSGRSNWVDIQMVAS